MQLHPENIFMERKMYVCAFTLVNCSLCEYRSIQTCSYNLFYLINELMIYGRFVLNICNFGNDIVVHQLLILHLINLRC